jgi:hypothetical protein
VRVAFRKLDISFAGNMFDERTKIEFPRKFSALSGDRGIFVRSTSLGRYGGPMSDEGS